ncbi:hypothetical protein DSO57_1006979 [Entomophthora muscae]|uniref:Uncharacterized protein n=1 Tax=Entomophthora muscae TaxID=34485 RepID=A0ACC2UHN6_9FUNG|nr:hypothetical protein DSO57_1006979 [Entomophthora muscae]
MFFLAFGALLSYLASSAQAAPVSAIKGVDDTPTDVVIPSDDQETILRMVDKDALNYSDNRLGRHSDDDSIPYDGSFYSEDVDYSSSTPTLHRRSSEVNTIVSYD